jgi:hypothetical protein
VKDLTPRSMRCEWGGCPAVYDLGDGRLLFVGKIPLVDENWPSRVKIGFDEAAITIDKALLATIRDEVREECAMVADAYRKDGDWNQDTCEAIARNIRALKEAP